jgi:hypothetical protein
MAKFGEFPRQTAAEATEADHQNVFILACETPPLLSQ